MRIVIIGGTGHVGTYLVPKLVKAGHEVISVSRQQRTPYHSNDAWRSVSQISIDRIKAEKKNNFGKQIRDLEPDVVIDMICFTLESAQQIVEALYREIAQFIHCGTIWVHGHSTQVPTVENQGRHPFGEYGINKAKIEEYLLTLAKKKGFPATILHPGHIVGPGWAPVNPAGNFNVEVFRKLANNEELLLPNFGMETLHHVHADDVAQSFMRAIIDWSNAVGDNFHVVSAQAITLRGYAEAVAAWFIQEAKLRFLPWEEWKLTVSKEDANATWDHIAHSPNCSIEKARKYLNYSPKYNSLAAIKESVNWLEDNDQLF